MRARRYRRCSACMTTSHALEPFLFRSPVARMESEQCEGRGHGKALQYFQDRIRIFQSRPTLPRFLCVATTSSKGMAAPRTRKPMPTSGLGAPSCMAVCASGIERLSDHQNSFCGGCTFTCGVLLFRVVLAHFLPPSLTLPKRN